MDDIKIMRSKNIKFIARVKMKFTTAFNIIDIRLINLYLSLKIEKKLLKENNKAFTTRIYSKIFIKYHFDKINPISISIKEIVLKLNFFTKTI